MLTEWLKIFAAEGGAAGNGLLNSLIAYWPGNETDGDLLDAHTNALHLTDVNTVTSNPGHVYPTARQYTNENIEYHTRASEALLQLGDVDFTFATWVYLDNKATERFIIAKDNVVTAREYSLFYRDNNDRFRWVVGTGGESVIGTVDANNLGSPNISTWYFIVVWHDSVANTVNIQVNDGTVDSVATSGAAGSTTQAFMIGHISTLAPAASMAGRIGPVAFWKSASGGGGVLSSSQRSALWNGGAGLKYEDFTV